MATISNKLNSLAPPDAAQNVTENTTCLILNFGSIGVERKVSKAQIKEKGVDDATMDECPVEVDADKDLLRVSKRLIVSGEFDAIQKGRRDFRRWLDKLSVPSLFKEGIYRVCFKAVPKISDRLKEFIAEDHARVEAFLAVYKQRCDETLARLKELGETTEYPPLAKVESAFYVDYHWMTFATDEKLKAQVSEEFFKEAKAHSEIKMQQATDALIAMKRQQAKDLYDHLVEVLTPNADGTKKRFQKSTVDNLKEFMENFRLTDAVGDSQLDLIIETSKKLLDGVDAKMLRENEAQASNTLTGLSVIKKCLDALVDEAGTRKIVFAPEPEVVEESSELEDAFAEVG